MADLIQGSDSLNQGRVKLNKSIEQSERAENKAEAAVNTSKKAEQVSMEANHKSEYAQTHVDQVLGATTIDPAVEQMKVGSDGRTIYNSPDERVRKEHQEVTAQLTQIPQQPYITNKARKTELDMVAKQTRRINNLPKNFRLYKFPSQFNYTNLPINVFTDGKTFITDYNKEHFKHKGGTTYHVTTTGIAGNDGLTKETAKTLRSAYSTCVDGDTILIHSGVYERLHLDWQGVFDISKNLNIIANGDVRFYQGDFRTYTKTEGYSFVYETSSAITTKIIDTNVNEYGYAYAKVSSIAEVETNRGSWYFDGTKIYVHTLKDDNPNGYVVNLYTGLNWFRITNDGLTKNLTVYMEGIKITGGESRTLSANRLNTSYTLKVYIDDVWCLHGAGTRPGIRNEGAEVLLNECVSLFHENDGISYVTPNARGIEINCISAHNGLSNIVSGSDGVHNGSTAHDGSKVIRINGEYFNNFGGNVADVHVGTQSVNLGCRAYDSATGYKDYRDTDFTAQQAGTEMWLDSCDSWGSAFSIQAVADTTIYIRNTTYDLLGGSGQIVEY